MKIRALAAAILVGTLALAVSDTGFAQSTLGGAKQQQNKIGGVAKPPPVVGGAIAHTALPPNPPKPAPVVNLANKPGALTPGSSVGSTGPSNLSGQTAGNTAPHPPFTPPGKGSAVVSTSSNLKCAGGACASKGVKP
jgi:hypothetical protein